jgi:drug/metabolite transporter (DMT)-like permease
MSPRTLDHVYILSTILFTVYSQLVMRWQVSLAGPLPADTAGKAAYIGHLLLNPWVVTGIVSTFFAGVSWMLAMTKFEISYAFPYVSLNYVLVLLAAVMLFHESVTGAKLLGTVLVVAGILVIARGG